MKTLRAWLPALFLLAACGTSPELPEWPPRGALEVRDADGYRLGRLQAVGEWTLEVWDEAWGLLFEVNELTGYVTSRAALYEAAACGGEPHELFWYGDCESVPAGASAPRRRAFGLGGDAWGFARASEVVASAGPARELAFRSTGILGEEACCEMQTPQAACAARLARTGQPTAYPLPLTIQPASPL